MRRYLHGKPVSCVVFLLFMVLGTPAPADEDYSDIVFFSDSLSDPGNAFVLTGQVSTAPFNLVPDAPYARGGLHFSNGRTWAERFAREMEVRSGPAFRKPGVFSNYAVGGARARPVGAVDLTTQVNLYLSRHGGQSDSQALYALFIGGNDLRDALQALAGDPTGAVSAVILWEAITAIADNIATLAASGARRILVFNAPDLSLVPAVRLQGPAVQGAALLFSTRFNQGLATALDNLNSLFPTVEIVRFDVFRLFNEVVAQPARFGLKNVAQTCITPGTIVGAVCNRPDRYLFWDGIHPSRKGHRIIAEAVGGLFEAEDD